MRGLCASIAPKKRLVDLSLMLFAKTVDPALIIPLSSPAALAFDLRKRAVLLHEVLAKEATAVVKLH
jgi:hypothetical protein